MTTSLPRVLPFAALTLVAATPRPVAVDGWTFTWKVTVEAADAKQTQRAAPPSMKVSLVPGKARVDYMGETPPGQKRGSYVIIDAAKGDFIMVSPEDKAAVIMDPGALGGALNAISATKLVKMEVSDVSASVNKVGPGEKILGRATTRYRVTRDYKMDVAVLGRHNRTAHHEEGEWWIADEKFLEDRVFEAWAKNFTGRIAGATGESFKKLMDAEAQMPRGIMMKMVTTSTDTDEKGKEQKQTIAMEMQDLSKGALDAALFEIPAGYQVTDMKAQMAAMSDSLKAAKAECEKEKGKGNCEMPSVDSALKAGAKEGAKESAADAAKKKLKGFFKKP